MSIAHDGGAQAGVTLARDAIHDPSEPRHFMRIKPVDAVVTVSAGDVVIARTERALRLLEVGKDFHDPVFYIPRDDVLVPVTPGERTTRCPLKGESRDYDVTLPDGAGASLAWSYERTFDFAAALRGRIAFDPRRVCIEERPAHG